VILVVGLQIGVFFLKAVFMEMMGSPGDAVRSPFWAGFVLGIGTVVFAIAAYMFLFGFLATACHEGLTKKEPVELLRAGRYFFWRMVRFELLFSVAWIGLFFLITSIISALILGIKPGEVIPDWVLVICMFAGLLILLKPVLLVPAIMIAWDKMVLESVKLLKAFKLREAKELLVFAGVSLLVMLGLSFLMSFGKAGSYYPIMGAHAVLSSVFVVLICLSAVRFAALSMSGHEEELKENTERGVTLNNISEED
jgi:hypothetical protein